MHNMTTIAAPQPNLPARTLQIRAMLNFIQTIKRNWASLDAVELRAGRYKPHYAPQCKTDRHMPSRCAHPPRLGQRALEYSRLWLDLRP
jgi:hypothetical protein